MPRIVAIILMVLSLQTAIAQEMIEHVVQRGETFALVAERYGITEQMLRKSNDHVDVCYVGLTLQINPSDIEAARKYRAQMESERREREQHARYEQAWSLMDAGKYKEAQKIFDKIIGDAPTGLAYYNRGVCYYNREKWNDAARDFGFAIKASDSSEELKEQGRELRDAAQKNQEIKEQRRAQMWSDIFGLGLGVASVTMNAYAAANYSPQPYFGNYSAPVYSDPCVQASIGVAQSSNVVMQANQAIIGQYQTAIDNGWYWTPTSTSTSTTTTYGGGSPHSSSGRQKKECGACGGKGWIPETKGVVSFGNDKWCDECKKTVPSNHYHAECPSCKGAGEW